MSKLPSLSKETIEKLNQTLQALVHPGADGKPVYFKENQERIVRGIMSGRDVLAILPTGEGKSVCYQVPAMHLPGITVVVSPLLALMEDQVKKLQNCGFPVACLSSAFMADHKGFHYIKTTAEQAGDGDAEITAHLRKIRDQIYSDTAQGRYKILYVTPERLRTGSFIRFAQHTKISLLAIDEAHCISLWGYEFRPRYMEISRLLQRIGYHPIIAAFTATATKSVRDDIVQLLHMKRPFICHADLERKNLHFSVWKISAKSSATSNIKNFPSVIERLRKIYDYLRSHPDDSGFIYCGSIPYVNIVYKYLKEKDIAVTRYYAGLDKDAENKEKGESKNRNFEAFRTDKKRVMVSTSALGMGIDKDNVRFVIHFNIPTCLENYYQEAGRAGRDGQDADCILCYAEKDDKKLCRNLLEDTVEQSELPDNARAIRADIAMQRLDKMFAYGQQVSATHEKLTQYITDYFADYEPVLSSAQKTHLSTYVSQHLKRIDVLYVNRTHIAQELRKGHMVAVDLPVGRAYQGHTAPSVSYCVAGEVLSYFDMMVADAVYTLMKHRVKTIYARAVMELLSGQYGLTLRPERKNEVEDSIRKMTHAYITIDRHKSLNYGHVFSNENLSYISGAFLPLEEKASGGFSYNPEKLPPLYEYAELLNGQFFSFHTRNMGAIFQNELPTSAENLSIAHYLLCRIDMIPRRYYSNLYRSITSPVIRMDTMLQTLCISLPEKTYYRQRKQQVIWDKMLLILECLRRVSFIKGYEPEQSKGIVTIKTKTVSGKPQA